MKNDEYDETSTFCHMFDRFFDCFNTRSIGEGRNKRKPDLEPYTSDKDKRLDVCKNIEYMISIAYLFFCSGWRMTSLDILPNGRTVLKSEAVSRRKRRY